MKKIHFGSFILLAIMVMTISLLTSCIPDLADINPPIVDIVYPADGSSVSGTVQIVVSASDDNKVEEIQIFVDGVRIVKSGKNFVSYSWDTTPIADNSEHYISAIAIDGSDNIGSSPVIAVTVNSNDDNTPPVVNIINPIDGQTVYGNINVIADATDNVQVEKVEFYIDGLAVDTVFNHPYDYLWKTSYNDIGDHTIFARASDSSSNTSISPVITVRVDTTHVIPVVTIRNPLNGQVVSGIVNIVAEAYDDNGVERVEFYIDGIREQTVFAPPYSYSWNTMQVNAGDHNIYAKAFDLNGNSGLSPAITVTVDSLIDNIPPVVNIMNPLNGQIVSGTVNVTAEATDNIGVDKVDFFIDGHLKQTVSGPPYNYLWDTDQEKAGGHNIYARAFDLSGNSGISPVIMVTVDTLIDNISPLVNIVNPPNGQTVSGTVNILAEATDNIGVDAVDFFIDGIRVSTASAPPFDYSWNTASADTGIHNIFARAYDLSGNSSVSPIITVTVTRTLAMGNILPKVSIVSPNRNGALFSERDTKFIRIKVKTPNGAGVQKVEFYIDGKLLRVVTKAEDNHFEYNWNIKGYGDGLTHAVFVKAYDNWQNTSADLLVIRVNP